MSQLKILENVNQLRYKAFGFIYSIVQLSLFINLKKKIKNKIGESERVFKFLSFSIDI